MGIIQDRLDHHRYFGSSYLFTRHLRVLRMYESSLRLSIRYCSMRLFSVEYFHFFHDLRTTQCTDRLDYRNSLCLQYINNGTALDVLVISKRDQAGCHYLSMCDYDSIRAENCTWMDRLGSVTITGRMGYDCRSLAIRTSLSSDQSIPETQTGSTLHDDLYDWFVVAW